MYNGPINGNYGPLTKAAVKKFQKANKLTTDGILGVKTIELLNKVI
jgi:peptidoglycan hydrolase-like protein with peptidoglycan-binding domain